MRFFRNFFSPTPGFPFLALFFIIIVLCTVYGIQMRELVKQNNQFSKTITQVTPTAERANLLINTMVAIGNDLLAIVDESPTARKIVDQYQIKQSEAATD
jgi:hypothetical protein